MKIFATTWNNFKAQPDIWFFYGFLITFTLSIRKVLFFYPVGGQFNEWTGTYLYLSDIFWVLTVFSWMFVILQNNNASLSIASIQLWLKKAYLNPHTNSIDLKYTFKALTQKMYSLIPIKKGKIGVWVNLPFILVMWSFASILWSADQNIALFRAIKLLEFYLLYLYIIFRIVPRLPRETYVKNIFKIIIILGFIQAIIGIFQFMVQHSIGLFWLFESHISPNIDGVARIVFHGDKYIRAYGLFPHPNILGGFLLISIILTWAYSKMFHACPVEQNCSTPEGMFHVEHPTGQAWNNSVSTGVEHFNVSWGGTIINISLIIQIIALILTFSKSALLGLIIAFCYISWKNEKLFQKYLTKCHSCENRNPVNSISIPSGFRIPCLPAGRKSGMTLILMIIILILSLYLSGLNFGDNLNKSLSDRINQWNVSPSLNCSMWNNLLAGKRETIIDLLIGSGSGQYVMELYSSTMGNLEAWQYQPIHNVFLLILAELGFVGFFVFAFFLWKLLHLSSVLPLPRGGNEGGVTIFMGILLGFIFIMFFDHYLWDIQQGQIMLWLVMGLIAGQLCMQEPETS